MNDTLEYLLSKIREERMARGEAMADGALQSYEDYKYVTGVIRGLLIAEEIINDLAKRMENSDE
jgi:hypothetical protein